MFFIFSGCSNQLAPDAKSKMTSEELVNIEGQPSSKTKNLIDTLLRTYTGLFKQEVKIDEFLLAKKSNTTSKQVIANLERLEQEEILTYNSVKTDSEIRFLLPREDDKTINKFSKEIKTNTHNKHLKNSPCEAGHELPLRRQLPEVPQDARLASQCV